MADNSNNRKKTLFVSVLLFLLAGGGVFLFMVIQGSNDLTKGKGNTFTYGSAAREGVSSFFKYIGVSEEEGKLSGRTQELMIEKREEKVAEAAAANPDISDWMEPSAKPRASASPTAVPRMGAAGLSGAGGIGSGGSKSSGGSSRFSEGSGLGNTKISKNSAGGGAAEGGTLASLTNARARLGEGLRSGSAMTAKGKWDSSFGVGGGSAKGDMTYGKSGLVNLDGIKKGEIDNLKIANAKSLKVTEPGEFQRDEKAEEKDAGLQAAKQAAKEEAEAAAKKAAIEAAIKAAAQGASGTGGGTGGTAGGAGAGGGDGKSVPEGVKDTAIKAIFSGDKFPGGVTAQDSTINYTTNSDGSYNATYSGVATTSTGTKIPYTQTAKISASGEILGWN